MIASKKLIGFCAVICLFCIITVAGCAKNDVNDTGKDSETLIQTEIKNFFKNNLKYALKDIRIVEESDGSFTVVTTLSTEYKIDDFALYAEQVTKVSELASTEFNLTFSRINPTLYTDTNSWIGWSNDSLNFYDQDKYIIKNVSLDMLKNEVEKYKKANSAMFAGETASDTVPSLTTVSELTLSTVAKEPELVSTNFFSDMENRLKYDELYKSYHYSELKNFIQAYIKENEVTNDDVAYTILEYIDLVIPFESEWNISFDEFDSKYILTFNEATEISSNNSVSVLLTGTNLDIKVGFRKNEWLFFDEIALSVDGKKAYSASVKSYNRTENVISGNTIEEYCSCSFYDNILESIGKSETVILRFSNKKSGEFYDHTLSQSEKDALYCGLLLRINNRDLSNLIYHYREDNNINDTLTEE